MSINIGDKNKIKNSNLIDGENNKIQEKKEKFNVWLLIILPIVTSVIAGILIWILTK